MTRRLANVAAVLTLGLAIGSTATAVEMPGVKHPRYLWTLPGPWGDPSPKAAANGLEFWMPHTGWAVAVGDTGRSYVQFLKMEWRGWGRATATATGLVEGCAVQDLRCNEPIHVRLVLTRQRPISCGHESPAGTLVYTRYELIGYRRLAGVRHATRIC